MRRIGATGAFSCLPPRLPRRGAPGRRLVMASVASNLQSQDADRVRIASSLTLLAMTDLLVLFALAHDLGRVEVDAAGRERVADEEIVGQLGVVILARLEVRVFGGRERQLDRLRDDLALERGDRRLDRDRDLRRPGAARGALQALIPEFARRTCGSRSPSRRRTERTAAWRRSSPERRRCRRPER